MTQAPAVHSFVHHDYISSDPKATEAFFSKVFGWKFQSWDPTYSLFEGPAGTTGGLRAPEGAERPGVLNYVLVERLEKTLADVEAAGGQVLVRRQEVPNMGALAVFLAPGGIVQGLWEPAPSA